MQMYFDFSRLPLRSARQPVTNLGSDSGGLPERATITPPNVDLVIDELIRGYEPRLQHSVEVQSLV
jgi:predicted component of type VI protein secretion system